LSGGGTTVDEFSIEDDDDVDDDVAVLELAAGATVVVVVAITIGFDSTTRVLGSDAVVTTLCNYLRKNKNNLN